MTDSDVVFRKTEKKYSVLDASYLEAIHVREHRLMFAGGQMLRCSEYCYCSHDKHHPFSDSLNYQPKRIRRVSKVLWHLIPRLSLHCFVNLCDVLFKFGCVFLYQLIRLGRHEENAALSPTR